MDARVRGHDKRAHGVPSHANIPQVREMPDFRPTAACTKTGHGQN